MDQNEKNNNYREEMALESIKRVLTSKERLNTDGMEIILKV